MISLVPLSPNLEGQSIFLFLAACSELGQHMWPYQQFSCCSHNFWVHWCLSSLKNMPSARWRCHDGGIFFTTISLIIATPALFPLRLELLLCTASPVRLHLCSRIPKRCLQIWEPVGDTETALSYSWNFVANTFLGHTIIQCLKKEFIERCYIKGYSYVLKCHLCCVIGVVFNLKDKRRLKKIVV